MRKKEIYVCHICGLEVLVLRKGGMQGVNSDADGIIALTSHASPRCCGREMSVKRKEPLFS
jgi:hypothetical protein